MVTNIVISKFPIQGLSPFLTFWIIRPLLCSNWKLCVCVECRFTNDGIMSTVLVGRHVKREFISENINNNLQREPTFRFISVFHYFLDRDVGLCKMVKEHLFVEVGWSKKRYKSVSNKFEETTYVSFGYRGKDNSKMYLEETRGINQAEERKQCRTCEHGGTEHSVPWKAE
jgi:hypothetical protein